MKTAGDLLVALEELGLAQYVASIEVDVRNEVTARDAARGLVGWFNKQSYFEDEKLRIGTDYEGRKNRGRSDS